MEYLSGVVERITYTNEENGFSVIKIKSKGFADLVTVVGNLAAVNVGATIRLKGEWKYDSKFGRQFNVVDYRETVPATIAGIEKYLGSGLIKGIGPVFVRRIVGHFREDTLRVIEEEADNLIHVEGIGQKRVNMIKKAWQEQKEIKNVMLRNLLYTCVTRAKKILVLVGSKKAIGIAVSNNKTQKRNTMLVSRLRNSNSQMFL